MRTSRADHGTSAKSRAKSAAAPRHQPGAWSTHAPSASSQRCRVENERSTSTTGASSSRYGCQARSGAGMPPRYPGSNISSTLHAPPRAGRIWAGTGARRPPRSQRAAVERRHAPRSPGVDQRADAIGEVSRTVSRSRPRPQPPAPTTTAAPAAPMPSSFARRPPAHGSATGLLERDLQVALLRPARTEDPPLRLVDHDVVDAGLPPHHQPALVELPVLVAVAAVPGPGRIVGLVLEAHGDAVARERPQRLAQGVVELALPLLGQELDDRVPAAQEPVPVAPDRVLAVGERHPVRIAGVPGVLGGLDLLLRGLEGERWQRRTVGHRALQFGENERSRRTVENDR